VDEHAVLQANGHVGLSCCDGMSGMARERIAYHRLDGPGGHALDEIAGIDVANDNREAQLSKIVPGLCFRKRLMSRCFKLLEASRSSAGGITSEAEQDVDGRLLPKKSTMMSG